MISGELGVDFRSFCNAITEQNVEEIESWKPVRNGVHTHEFEFQIVREFCNTNSLEFHTGDHDDFFISSRWHRILFHTTHISNMYI